MTTLTITAFGYDHEFTDDFSVEGIDLIENAPVLYLFSGNDDLIDGFEAELPMDSVLLWSDAGEALVFGYEEMAFREFV